MGETFLSLDMKLTTAKAYMAPNLCIDHRTRQTRTMHSTTADHALQNIFTTVTDPSRSSGLGRSWLLPAMHTLIFWRTLCHSTAALF